MKSTVLVVVLICHMLQFLILCLCRNVLYYIIRALGRLFA